MLPHLIFTVWAASTDPEKHSKGKFGWKAKVESGPRSLLSFFSCQSVRVGTVDLMLITACLIWRMWLIINLCLQSRLRPSSKKSKAQTTKQIIQPLLSLDYLLCCCGAAFYLTLLGPSYEYYSVRKLLPQEEDSVSHQWGEMTSGSTNSWRRHFNLSKYNLFIEALRGTG